MNDAPTRALRIYFIGFRLVGDVHAIAGFSPAELLLGFTVSEGVFNVHVGPFRFGVLW